MQADGKRLEYAMLVVVIFVLGYQLFVGPIVGLGNSGDQNRVMDWAGLSYASSDTIFAHRWFVYEKYIRDNPVSLHYPTSEVAFLGLALSVNSVASRDGFFDIRMMGLAHSLGFLAALLVFFGFSRRLPRYIRLVLYGVIALMYLDVGCVAYYNSFFCEASSQILLLMTISIGLVVAIRDEDCPKRRLYLIAYYAAAALFITSKVQNVLLSVPLAIIGYRLATLAKHGPAAAWRRLVGPAVLVVVSLGYLLVFAALPNSYRSYNLYNSVFYEILPHSESPQADIAELGLDPEMMNLSGTSPWDKGASSEVLRSIDSRLSFGRIVLFYVRHPARLLGLAERAAEEAFSMRPSYLGSLERTYQVLRGLPGKGKVEWELPPEYESRAFAVWSNFKAAWVPKSLWVVVAFLMANFVAALLKRLKCDATEGHRRISEVHLALVAMAVLEFFSVILGDGEFDVGKHLFLFNLICEMCLLFLAAYAIAVARHFTFTNWAKRGSHVLAPSDGLQEIVDGEVVA